MPTGFHHVCFAVPDLRAAMDELTALVGVAFGRPLSSRLGPWPYSLAFTEQPPHIELISSVEGSPWETTTPTFHHLGWWSRCLPETIEHWTDNGGGMRFDGREYGRRFAYVDAPRSGARLEAVDSVQRSDFLHRWVRNSATG